MTTTTVSSTTPQQPGFSSVDAQQVQQWLAKGEAVLIDVREPDEHARESIEAAELRPLSTLSSSDVPEAKRVVLHCRTGTRSREAAAKLVAAGCAEIYSMEGGIEAWRRFGLPTRINRRAPLPIMRQVQITAGSLVVLGTVLGVIVSPWWLILSGFVGAGLVFAGISGMCGMANVLSLMPWNRTTAASCRK